MNVGAAADSGWQMHRSVMQLWARFREAHPNAPVQTPKSFHFCDNPDDANACAALVREGRKRASAPSVAELLLAGEPLPRRGDLAIVTDWNGEAQAIIRTSSVEIRRFAEVDEDFARAEGEGDGTLSWWRTAHLAYYKRALAGSDYRVDDELEVACERFQLLLLA